MPIQPTAKIWMNGKLVDWADATIHIATHTLHYGTGVFEGIRAYETAQGPGIFRLTDHIVRLHNSAKILMMPMPYSVDERDRLPDLDGAETDLAEDAGPLGAQRGQLATDHVGGFGARGRERIAEVAVAGQELAHEPAAVTSRGASSALFSASPSRAASLRLAPVPVRSGAFFHPGARLTEDGPRPPPGPSATATARQSPEVTPGSMPRPGFEPGAYSLGGSRSIQLSYRGRGPVYGRESPPRRRSGGSGRCRRRRRRSSPGFPPGGLP